MVNMDAFASAFGLASKQGETWFTLGKVTAVNGSKLSVLMGGSATPTECEAYCIAGVGDVVLIIIKDGAPRAIATHGGVNDAAKWRDALGLGSMALEDSSDYLPVSGGTLTGSLTLDNSSVSISHPDTWRDALGIGTVKSSTISTNVSVAKSTYKSIGSISLEAGKWIITYGASYSTSTSGLRSTYLYTSQDAAADTSWYLATCIQTAPASGGSTYHHGSHIVTPSATQTYYLSVWQNSGGSLNCKGAIYAVKVG